MSNLGLLNKNSPDIKGHKEKKCFSCNFYQALYIAVFIKEITSITNFEFHPSQIDHIKKELKDWIFDCQIQTIKNQLIEALASFCVEKNLPVWKEIGISQRYHKEIIDFYCKYISLLKSKNHEKLKSILAELGKVIQTQEFIKYLTIHERIKLFVYYFMEWENLQAIEEFSKDTEIARLKDSEMTELKPLISLTASELFSVQIDSVVKAYLKVLPSTLLP